MNTTALLIGLGPVIAWGFYPTVVTKIGGRPVNQILGSTLGTFIFALAFSQVYGIAFPSGTDLLFSILSGASWACAQIITFIAFPLVGSSRVTPISTAIQLVGTSLFGIIALGSWPTIDDKILGGIALFLIIIGATMTVWTEKKSHTEQGNLKKAVILLLIGGIGYVGYSAFPQATSIDGMASFLPQSIGMLSVAIVYAIVLSIRGEKSAFTESVSYKNIISGFFFGFAALTYLISAQPNMNGMTTAFILSQTNVIVATLSGIYLLGQRKTKKEMFITLVGLLLIVAAATITVFI